MINIIDKINLFIEKVGKRNFLILVLVVIAVIVGGLYGTFSIFTSSEGGSVIDGIMTYKFILNETNDTNSITIAPKSSKFVAVTISNPEKLKLKYGIYYSSNNDLTDVDLGYLYDSEYLGNGLIGANEDYVVKIKINNDSINNVTINFGVSYGLEKGGELNLGDGRYWLDVYGELASVYVQNLYNDGSELKSGNGENIFLNDKQKIMLDNNDIYRYYGENPNNYIKFNDELWRIVSVSNDLGEYRLKIVREDSIGTFSYDTTNIEVNSGLGVNDWGSSDLVGVLNELYYNGLSGNCYNGEANASSFCDFTNIGFSDGARDMIDDSLYYLGAFSKENVYYASDSFKMERSGSVFPANSSVVCDDGSCPRSTSWLGKVGLLYLSDYLYSTDLSVCLEDGDSYGISEGCVNNSWISSDDLWFINPSIMSSFEALSLSNGIISEISVASAKDVYPVLYLKSNIIIRRGSGIKDDPYVLEVA